MVDSYLSTKFGIYSLNGFWENASHERMTDNSPYQYAITSGCDPGLWTTRANYVDSLLLCNARGASRLVKEYPHCNCQWHWIYCLGSYLIVQLNFPYMTSINPWSATCVYSNNSNLPLCCLSSQNLFEQSLRPCYPQTKLLGRGEGECSQMHVLTQTNPHNSQSGEKRYTQMHIILVIET